MPALAAFGFLLVLVVLGTLGVRNGRLLGDIESGYFPAYEASNRLEGTLTGIQRSLQDAVGAADRNLLAETDGLRDRFGSILAEAGKNRTIEPARLQRIQSAF